MSTVSNECIIEMLFDELTLDALGPVLLLLDHSRSVDPSSTQQFPSAHKTHCQEQQHCPFQRL